MQTDLVAYVNLGWVPGCFCRDSPDSSWLISSGVERIMRISGGCPEFDNYRDPPLAICSRRSWFHIVSKNMSFTACCWKSRRIKETHVEFGECIYLQVSRVPPSHLQANIFLFTHACWWQNHVVCVWIFRLLVSPSSWKTEKNTSPEQKLPLCWFCGRFCERSCQKERLSVAFVVFANHCAFKAV